MAVNGTRVQPEHALLACGRDAAVVWDAAVAGRSGAHERACLHCQAVTGDQRLLASAVAELHEEALEPPASLVGRVMGVVLAEIRPAGYLPLPTRHGRARIDRVAAAGVLRHAVDQMPALRVRSCQIHQIESAGPDDPAQGTPPIRVQVSVTARFGLDLFSATARVRQMLLAAAADLLGLTVTAVDVEVVDVFEDPTGAPAGAEAPSRGMDSR
ncbi:MAG: Asp23/Gls24 family envelope stress response protein [Pseudonocardiaceae bacterium]